ncbi:hypothetical protein VNO78_25354 [Psophocarpus tetragonolobus]|uniref:Uncharacterized protein n=1 Tax=Psophocarpus tetragonolobus TaxID=3891 RepID=A0AAN9S7M6_PSOTE
MRCNLLLQCNASSSLNLPNHRILLFHLTSFIFWCSNLYRYYRHQSPKFSVNFSSDKLQLGIQHIMLP